MASPKSRGRDIWKQHGAATFVLLAMAFLLLVPDPHDHGDTNSLGGLFRLLFPDRPHTGAQQSGAKPRPGPNGFCPIHFWQQVASTGLLLALLLRFFLSFEFRVPSLVAVPALTNLGSFHSRAPPILP